MAIQIHPAQLRGDIVAPPSKSEAQRAFTAAFIRRAHTTVVNAGDSADELAVLDVLRQAGCTVEHSGAAVTIDSTAATIPTGAVSFQESGLAARMLIPVLALNEGPLTFTGTGTLLARPMGFLIESLEGLGLHPQHQQGRLPISVQGPFIPRDLEVDGAISSQGITGLIMSYVAAGADKVTIRVKQPVSTPYLSLTLKVLEDLRMPVPTVSDDFTEFRFTNRPIPSRPATYRVGGDWSNAAMLLVAGAIGGDVRVTGLDVFTAQGDKAILQALGDAGVRLSITTEFIHARESPLKPFHFNATDTPDLFPALAVLAAYASSGTSVIEGTHRLIDKESNRAVALQEELGKMGIVLKLDGDLMLIEGGQTPQGGAVDSRGDHRIAMACAVAALRASAPTLIENESAVAKSYPRFFADLSALGANTINL